MKIRQFLDHHGIGENPFADEDAQTDLIFKGYCIRNSYHPAWDKIYGNPAEPATAVVFGEKGSGKTALRLQIARHLADYNAEHPDQRTFAIQYDDFNPFLDRFRDRVSRRRRVEKVLGQWKLWDHMDAILSLGVTQLVDRLLQREQSSTPAGPDLKPLPLSSLDRAHARDVLLLCAVYDQSTADTAEPRWHLLRQRLLYPSWRAKWDLALGAGFSVVALLTVLFAWKWSWLAHPWIYLATAAAWAPWLWRFARWGWRGWRIARSTRVLRTNAHRLRRLLMQFPQGDVVGQPLPDRPRTDDRYELLSKFQGVLRALGFSGVVVLIDRVDEPYLINGSAELMKALLWPLLDNKLLKHPGVGLKLLLPAELIEFVNRESRDFHQRARLDKQNLVPSLEWTGQSLYDMTCARIRACAAQGRAPAPEDLFDQSVDRERLINAMAQLRVPRQLFKFLYRTLSAHINAHSEESPVWKISGETFQSMLALQQRDSQDSLPRGIGAL